MERKGIGKIYPFFGARHPSTMLRTGGRAATINRRSYKAASGKFKRKFAWFVNLKKNLRRDFQRLRRRFSPKYIIFPLIAFVLISAAYTIFFSSLFAIQEVVVRITPGEDNLEEEVLKQEIKKRVSGANLLFVGSKKLSFLEDDLTIAAVEIKKVWTHGITVEVEKRVAKIVVSDAQGRLFVVDREGVIFSRGKVEGLAVIRIAENFSLGEKFSPEKIDFVLTLLGELSQLGFSLDFLEATESMRFKISEGPEIISPPQSEKIRDLLSILENYRTRGVPLKKIDLRHAHPVIQY